MTRLSSAALPALPPGAGPRVDPGRLGVGIVHLGLGAFHRAHQAVLTEDAAAAAGGDWGICGVTQRSGTVRRQLAPQDGLYGLLERGDGGCDVRVVGALREIVDGSADPGAVVARIATPGVHVVTLTVTEKGYRHDLATGRLRWEDPELAADLAGRPPRTTVGQLTAGLRARRRAGAGPVTVVCCDNLADNGATVAGLVRDFAARAGDGDELLAWMADHVRFPSTMVDRIVPATTGADRAEVAARLGVTDEGTVVAERYCHWVIEDDFAGPRPAWEQAGVVLTADARPWERAKVRLLNGSHSTIAYLGQLAGWTLMSEAVRRPPIGDVVRRLMADDVVPTLAPPPPGLDLGTYQGQLLERFANRTLPHRTAQVAMDGSQKLPQRLFGTIADRRRQGAEPLPALLCLAAWMRFVADRRDDSGRPLSVDDPLADDIATRVAGAGTAAGVVDALLGMRAVFDPELAGDAVVRDRLVELLHRLRLDGAEATAEHVASA